ncbi:hypothetical protein DJ568_13705 [Mucilaginibacter hurinus]|uniref:Alpha/beta hydrolase n=1 Tax=Mucilaginibacter hurinus TaxID=2201324 RepID=A0A367GLY2_9SPHI|nr:alpha/beta fold hydrolase [Mucilaginibacter hurinus]RCH54340.1 hypothetical protein DJ568_13705 [Mucilaginibacter hurinus]
MSQNKGFSLFIFLLFFVVTAFAQTEPKPVKDALTQFIKLYNAGEFETLFDKCSAETKTALPLDQFKSSFTQVKKQLGNMLNAELIKYEAPVAEYKATFEKSVVGFNLAINAQNQYQALFFKPFEAANAGMTTAIDGSLTETAYNLKTLSGNLSGSLVTPKNAGGKVPVVLIIPGSGPIDRNGNSDKLGKDTLKANTYALLANELGKKGIATLRYDKRGIGQSASSTKEAETRLDDMVEDALGIINDLNERNEFSKVIVLGHSEGSLVGIIAARDAAVNALISVAGAGESADKIMTEQMKKQPSYVFEGFNRVLDSMKRGKMTPNVDPSLYRFVRPSIQLYLMSWFRFDPAKEIKKLKIPMLLIQGTTDLQTSVTQAEKLKKAKSDAQLLIIPNMNHVLKEAPADTKHNLATYSNPNLPLKPELVNGIADFVNKLK